MIFIISRFRANLQLKGKHRINTSAVNHSAQVVKVDRGYMSNGFLNTSNVSDTLATCHSLVHKLSILLNMNTDFALPMREIGVYMCSSRHLIYMTLKINYTLVFYVIITVSLRRLFCNFIISFSSQQTKCYI